MHLNGSHPIHFRVSQTDKALRPWQAYASYLLTGGFLLYGSCADGFVVDKVFGTPEANPAHFEEARSPTDMAMFDLDSRVGQEGPRFGIHLRPALITEPVPEFESDGEAINAAHLGMAVHAERKRPYYGPGMPREKVRLYWRFGHPAA